MPLISYHSQIEAQIENFVENFKKNGSVLFNSLNVESYGTTLREGFTQWTPSDDSATDYVRNSAGCSSYDSSFSDSCSCNSDNDDAMDDAGCRLTVKDVANLLRARHAIITGGRTVEGYPIITFPDTGTFWSLSDEDYHKLILYLTNVPTLQDADLGFVIIIDRRNDKWSSVKTVLLKISGYFPGLIQVVFVLRPLGFFQKAISEVSNKLFREEFKFRLVICSNVEDIHHHVDPSQLTVDLGGSIPYNHEEWIQQRVAVENFTSNLQEISSSLREMTQRLQETEFPNDVQSTLSLLQNQGGEYQTLKEDIRSAAMHGETLLNCIRRPTSQSIAYVKCSDRFINAAAVQRLLLQLDETEKGFDNVWSKHEKRLSQCLELRKFEQEFKELQVILAGNLRELAEIPETGDSVSEVDSLLNALETFRRETEHAHLL